MYTIRRFEETDTSKVSQLIITTLRTSNIHDYAEEYIEKDVRMFDEAGVMKRASWTHFYIVENENEIVGCGAIGPYWEKTDESSLFTIFVSPDHQGEGIGRLIIKTLEQDEYFLRARRIEIPASITALKFYQKFGYDFKNGHDEVDEEQLYRLEKFR